MANKAANTEYVHPWMDKKGNWHAGVYNIRHLFGLTAATQEDLNKQIAAELPGKNVMIDYDDRIILLGKVADVPQDLDYEAAPV